MSALAAPIQLPGPRAACSTSWLFSHRGSMTQHHCPFLFPVMPSPGRRQPPEPATRRAGGRPELRVDNPVTAPALGEVSFDGAGKPVRDHLLAAAACSDRGLEG